MRARVINQRAAQGRMFETLNELLLDPEFDSLRVLMAFVRAPGVALLSQALSGFIERGGSAQAIIGLDLGGTSPDALEALHGIGVECHVFGVKGDRTFHPKVCLLDDSTTGAFSAVIGSNNWTAGGLDSNFEAAVRLDGLRGSSADDDELADELDVLWTTYAQPSEPLGAGHIRALDSELIADLAGTLPSEGRRPPDTGGSEVKDRIFDDLDAPREPLQRAPRKSIAHNPTPVPDDLPNTLYLEVTGPETGQLREIQVPVAALGDFFGVSRDDAYFMTFQHEDGTIEANRPLAMYDVNSTYRISSSKFSEVSEAERPMIVKLDRAAADTFDVSIIRKDTPPYAAAEPCLDRGGDRGKRWGIA